MDQVNCPSSTREPNGSQMQPGTCLTTAIDVHWCMVKGQAVAETGQLSVLADLQLNFPLGPVKAQGAPSVQCLWLKRPQSKTRRFLADDASAGSKSEKLEWSKVV
ncbi:uncharacterized protein N7503_010236 [Penicillium pulvis]|uniref:uncharacterized protein n=1 Tax=Penicillium pulvis TaxID=1562058 RepID=UPI002547F671|nr:uncharacterized protein N7503_010236 [Penicillium pulvis]KAJ5785024.1 hypothetical protein N7503_010236 [Penicillium pulvis]